MPVVLAETMSTHFVFARAAVAAGARSEDRAEVFEHDDTLIVVVADGAGGVVGGDVASDAVVDAVRRRIRSPFDPYDIRAWSDVLTTADAELARSKDAGEATAIIVVVGPYGLVGVSVGDSEAWVVGARSDRLTEKQERPRLGTGRCRPKPFHRRRLEGVLVVATDGLFKSARSETIRTACAAGAVTTIANALVASPRLRSGAYPDDVAVIVVTPKRTPS